VDQFKSQPPPYPPYFDPYPLKANSLRGYKPSFPNTNSSCTPCLPIPPKPKFTFGYWELLSPALCGTAAALFLSLFSNNGDQINERFGGTPFKLALIGYGIGASVAVSFAVSQVILNSKAPFNNLICPIGGAITSIIFLFAAEYLLLYRVFPSSFKGDVGEDLCTQFLSFLYFSVTTIATGNLGDILPTNTTPRLLIATEIAFNVYTLASGIQLLLALKS